MKDEILKRFGMVGDYDLMKEIVRCIISATGWHVEDFELGARSYGVGG